MGKDSGLGIIALLFGVGLVLQIIKGGQKAIREVKSGYYPPTIWKERPKPVTIEEHIELWNELM